MSNPLRTAERAPTSIGVLIATYRRTDALLRCLGCLEQQVLLPNEVLVVVREDDLETLELLQSFGTRSLPIRMVPVDIPGAVAARNAGLDRVATDIVAMIDDDTAPRSDWLMRVMDHFLRDPQLGGLGGRDRCFGDGCFNDAEEAVVGKLTWYGKVIGNHHVGFGPVREVDFLKGANMSFRTEAVANVRFDSRLKGTGAQPGEDGAFTVAVKNQGWKIAFDPSAVVEHFPAERRDVRHYVGVEAVRDAKPYWEFCYNQVFMVWYALSPMSRAVFFCWSCLIGTGVFPGLVQAIRFTPKLGVQSWHRFGIAQAAKLRAFRDLS